MPPRKVRTPALGCDMTLKYVLCALAKFEAETFYRYDVIKKLVFESGTTPPQEPSIMTGCHVISEFSN